MTYTVYLYQNCSTCKQAQSFLEKNDIAFTRKEIVVTPPTVKELEAMLKIVNGELKKLFNTSGMLYRELQLNEKLKTMTQDEALKLLSTEGMLVKRPFLLGKGIGLLGFKEDQWKSALK